VVSFGAEKTAELLVGEESIENVNLIDRGLSTLISDTGSSNHSGSNEMNFPERSMSEHHEGEACICNQRACMHVVGAVNTGANLVKHITSAHAPFPVIGVDHVSHIVELGWVTFGFVL